MIHLYWHTDPPGPVLRAQHEWANVTGEDIARIWTPADLPELTSRAARSCEDVAEDDHVRHIANVVRWHVLNEHGGVWADTDVWPLQRPNGYLNRATPWCAALGSVPTPFMCGGPAGHALWQRTLNAALDHPQGTSPHASGGRLLQTTALPGELELVPAKLFSERDASGRLLAPPIGGRYSTHEWNTSSTRRRARAEL